MSRSPSPPDFADLEEQLRDALRHRAASTPVTGRTYSEVRTLDIPRLPGRVTRRRAVVVAGVLAAAALVVVLVQDGPKANVDVVIENPASPGDTAPSGLPDAEVPRLLVEGATWRLTEGEGASPLAPVDPTEVLQAFRRPGRLDGPMIFVKTLRPYDPATFGLLGPDRDPVDVRGRVGRIAHDNGEQGATHLSAELGDGAAIFVTSLGLTDDELVAFVNGLGPGRDGRWVDTVAPRGVDEVTVTPERADGRYYGGRWDLPGGTSVDVNLYHGGFEEYLDDRVSGTVGPVRMVDVGGVPAASGAYPDRGWWVLLEPEPGRIVELSLSTAGDGATVDQMLVRARFVDEATWDAATAGA